MQSLLVGLMVGLVVAEPEVLPPPVPISTPVPVPDTVPAVPESQPSPPPPESPWPYVPAPGWFGALEGEILWPHLEGRRLAPASFLSTVPAGFLDINVGGLDGIGAVRGALGYRLDGGWGEFTLTYRGGGGDHQTLLVHGDPVLAALLQQNNDSNVTVRPADPGSTASTSLTTRIDLSTFDLGYGRHETVLGPLWDLRWQAGGRLATFFTDDRRQGPDTFLQAANHYIGSGPFLGVGLTRFLTSPGGGCIGSLYTRAGGGVLFGQDQLTFRETVAGEASRVDREGHGQAVPMLEVEAGISGWSSEHPERRLQLGYRYERWWGVGSVGDSRLDLTLHGLFLRWERNF
ncbi:MAG: hypothetical protein HYS12_28575 [Planctomycetes bacterium]|nr:hypothetical protein [Planctomycetota bacterium]